MKKTVRSLLTVLLVLSLLSAIFMVSAFADSGEYKDTKGNVVLSVSSTEDVIGGAELVAADVSGVYPGFTLDDDSYRKVLLAYEIKFVENGKAKDFSDTSFKVRIRLPEAIKNNSGLEAYALNADGEGTKITAAVNAGYIEFDTADFGLVAVAVAADAPVPYVEPDFTWLIILIVVLVVLAIAGGVVLVILHIRKKKAAEAAESAPEKAQPDAEATPEVAEATEEPAEIAAEDPEVVEDPVAVVQEEPEAVEEPVAVAQEEPEAVEEPAAVAQEEPEVVEEPAAVAQEEPEAVEEPVAVVAEEPAVVLEPAPVAELKPVININFVEAKEDGQLPEGAVEAVRVRFRTSFESRYIQSGALQDYYTAIKNALLSYKGVKSRMSWNYDAFNKGRVQCAKINIKGNALLVYLNLDPASYNAKKYHFNDMSAKPKFKDVPLLMKVKSDRALKYTLELIAEMMKVLEIPEGKVANLDYHRPYQSTEELATLGLVKVILPAGMKLEDNASVIKTNVGEMLSGEEKAD